MKSNVSSIEQLLEKQPHYVPYFYASNMILKTLQSVSDGPLGGKSNGHTHWI